MLDAIHVAQFRKQHHSRAIFAELRHFLLLPYLQPFADINKHSSRVAANPPLTFLDVPEAAGLYADGDGAGA